VLRIGIPPSAARRGRVASLRRSTRQWPPAAQELLLHAAQAGNDTGRILEAHHSLWATFTAMGQPTAALTHAERGIALYDRDRHAVHAFQYGGHDPGVCCRYHRAINRWLLGYPDQALLAIREAYRLAEQLRHPMTSAITLCYMGWVHYQRGERDAAADTAERLNSIVEAHGFRGWSEVGIVLTHVRGTARVDVDAVVDTRRRLFAARSAQWRHIFALCAFAELCLEAGHPEQGLQVLAELEPADRDAFCASEIHRIEGELLLRMKKAAADVAEERFRTAVDLARRRAEKSLELRAAISLARLWHRQQRKQEASQVLAGVYDWFTEGLGTRDLIAAKTLLEELQAWPVADTTAPIHDRSP